MVWLVYKLGLCVCGLSLHHAPSPLSNGHCGDRGVEDWITIVAQVCWDVGWMPQLEGMRGQRRTEGRYECRGRNACCCRWSGCKREIFKTQWERSRQTEERRERERDTWDSWKGEKVRRGSKFMFRTHCTGTRQTCVYWWTVFVLLQLNVRTTN